MRPIQQLNFLRAQLVLCCMFGILGIGCTHRMWAQSSPDEVYHGSINTDVPNAVVLTRSGIGITGGFTQPPSANKLGLIMWDTPGNIGQISQAKTYSLGAGDFEIVAMDTAVPSGTIAVVANRTDVNNAADAVFFHVAANGSVLGTRYWATTARERFTDVKALSDGTFMVAGSVAAPLDGTQRAFVARVGGPSQSYAIQWVRLLGIGLNAPQAKDEAIDIEQSADGGFLVCVFSDQAATTSQGALLLWNLSQAGVTTSIQRYEMDASLIRPIPSDMKLLPDGRVYVCGSALQSAGSATRKGWYFLTDANLGNPICRSVTLTSYPTRNLELRAMDVLSGANPELWACGTVDRPISNTTADNQALIFVFSATGTPLVSLLNGPAEDDAYNDILMEQSVGEMRLAGPSNRPFHIVTDMLRTNFHLVRLPMTSLGSRCGNSIGVSVQTKEQAVTKTAITMTINSLMTTTSVFLAVNNFAMDNQITCQ